MAIRTVVTGGFGNGTFNGTIALVVTAGYAIGSLIVPTVPGIEYTSPNNRLHYVAKDNKLHYESPVNRLHYTAPEED